MIGQVHAKSLYKRFSLFNGNFFNFISPLYKVGFHITPQHADHARSHTRNADDSQLSQPAMPKSCVRGVVGVRVFGVRAFGVSIQITASCKPKRRLCDCSGSQLLRLSSPASEQHQYCCVHHCLQGNHEEKCDELPNFVIDWSPKVLKPPCTGLFLKPEVSNAPWEVDDCKDMTEYSPLESGNSQKPVYPKQSKSKQEVRTPSFANHDVSLRQTFCG